MIRPETVRHMWDDFAAATLPVGVSGVQRKETRRAYYAGFFAMLCAARSIGDDSVSEEEGVEWLEALHAEVLAFYEDVKAGRA
jgi:hypothetical protein